MVSINWQSLPLINLAIEEFNRVYDKISQWGNSADFVTEFPSLKRNVQNEFAYATRYLNVDQALHGKHISEGEIQELVSALLEGNWDADIFKNDQHFPYIALQAFKNATIGKEEFTNVMFYWSIRQHHISNIRVLSLYDSSGRLDYSIANALLSTMVAHGKEYSFIDKNQQKRFLDRLKKLPRSAQTFFVIPDIQPAPTNGIQPTISQRIRAGPKVNVFNRIYSKRMVPSFEMMQEFIRIMSPEHSVTIMPTVGLSTLEDIRKNGLLGQRDLGIPFPGIELPEKADGYRSIEYDFFYHDFYHAIQASNIPNQDRVSFIYVADICMKLAEQMPLYPSLIPFAKKIQATLIDMEHLIYSPLTHPGKKPNPSNFVSVIEVIHEIKNQAFSHLEKFHNGSTEKSLDDLDCSQYFKQFARKIVQLFSTSVDSQKEFCQLLIDRGKTTEEMLIKSFLGQESISQTYRTSWAIQGKELCQNPWLLASV